MTFIFLHDCTDFIATVRAVFSNAVHADLGIFEQKLFERIRFLHRLRSRKPNLIGPVVSAPPEELGIPSTDWKPID